MNTEVTGSVVRLIGLGGMPSAAATGPLTGGKAVELVRRDAAKAEGLGTALGAGSPAGTFGGAAADDIVAVAVRYSSGMPVVPTYADALAGRVVINISRTFNADARLVAPDGTSGPQEDASAVPASPHVAKASCSSLLPYDS